jgi:hypothetical protein
VIGAKARVSEKRGKGTKKKWKRARKGEKIMKNVAQDEADYIYNLTIYHVQLIYYLVI